MMSDRCRHVARTRSFPERPTAAILVEMTSAFPHRCVLAGLLVVAIGLAGCGGGGERDQRALALRRGAARGASSRHGRGRQLPRRQPLLRRRSNEAAGLPAARRGDARRGARGGAGRRRRRARVYEVKPDTVVVDAAAHNTGAAVGASYVLRDDVALDRAQIANPQQRFDEGPGATGEPVVIVRLQARGARAVAGADPPARRARPPRRRDAQRRRGRSASRDRRRRRAAVGALRRLPDVSRGHRRGRRRADLGRVHDRLRARNSPRS